MKTLPKKDQDRLLGGPIALLKAHGSQVFEYCAREAAQIFGGLSYTRGGQGEKVERLYREVRAYAIPAGSEEIMLDRKEKMKTLRSRAMFIGWDYQFTHHSLQFYSSFFFSLSLFLVGIRQAIKGAAKAGKAKM